MTQAYTKARDSYLKSFGAPAEANMFGKVVELIEREPNLRTKKFKERASLLQDDILSKLASSYFKGRQPKAPSFSRSPDDTAVFLVMESYFKTSHKDRDMISRFHRQAMGAENAVGFYIEYYIASVLENHGWTWCAGSIVDKVDFFKIGPDGKLTLVQIKSRDNTENSSSMSVRDGTQIEKWHRLESRTGRTCWSDFPEKSARDLLSEKNFQKVTRELLEGLAS